YTPQRGERSAECLSPAQREQVAHELPRLYKLYPKLLTPNGYAQALLHPPSSPEECTFSRLSKNYSADLKTHVEPCVFGGDPDCAQCGCSASAAAHWISRKRVVGPLKVKHFMRGSMRIGDAMARLQKVALPAWRERGQASPRQTESLVQISMD
ncbi:MAG: radical SAM protein, partial [Terracidiphilus sp.]